MPGYVEPKIDLDFYERYFAQSFVGKSLFNKESGEVLGVVRHYVFVQGNGWQLRCDNGFQIFTSDLHRATSTSSRMGYKRLGNRIYFMGGFTLNPMFGVTRLDVKASTTVTNTSVLMPAGSGSGGRGASTGRALYLFGNKELPFDGVNTIEDILKFSHNESFGVLNARLSGTRMNLGAVTVAPETILLVGGKSNAAFSTSVDQFKHEALSPRATGITQQMNNCSGCQAGSDFNRYVFAASPSTGPTKSLFYLDNPEVGTPTITTNANKLSTARDQVAAVYNNQKVYMIGGTLSGGGPVSTVDRLDGFVAELLEVTNTSLSAGLSAVCAVAFDTDIWTAGGYTGTTGSTIISKLVDNGVASTAGVALTAPVSEMTGGAIFGGLVSR